MNTHIDDLLLFSRLVELKSFTSVADRIQISRSLVSKRISALEDRTGVQLLNRTTRRLELTEAGRMLYQYCVQIEDLLKQAEEAVSDIRMTPRGLLNINAPISFGQLILPKIMTAFLEKFPDIRINLSLSDHYVNVIEGGFDVVIRIGELEDSTLKAKKIGSTQLKVFAHKDYLTKYGVPKVPQDLQQHNCLIYKHTETGPTEWHFDGPNGGEVVHVSGNFSAENGMPMYMAAQAGLGISTQPDFVIEEMKDKGIVYLLDEYARCEIGIYAIYPTTRKPPLNTRVFIDYIASAMKTR